MVPEAGKPLTLSRRLWLAVVVWLAMLGADFLLNAALFARIYQDGGTFMLDPVEAFRRIPIGYLAFLILAVCAVEVAYRLRVTGFAAGVRLGAVAGGLVGAVWALSLYSIATIGVAVAFALAVVWLALIAVGLGVAAAAVGQRSLRGLVIRVAAFDAACVAVAIALQSLGVVPTVKL